MSISASDSTSALGGTPEEPGGPRADLPTGPISTRSISPLRHAVRQLRHDRVAMVALAFLVFVIFWAVVSIWWTPYNPNQQDIPARLQNPSWAHWLGTDDLGRDTLSRLMVGARTSFRVAIQVVVVGLLIAVPLGLISGYIGGWLDNVLMRIVDALSSVPALVLAIAIAGVLGPGLGNAMIAITVVLIPSFARLIRAQALAVTTEPFVEASRSVGSRTSRILAWRIFPGVLSPLIVQVSLALGAALLADAALSFLGLGVQPPNPSWGSMLERGYQNIFRQSWGIFIPGAAIALSVLAFNSLGDGLRDALGVGARKKWRRKARLGLTITNRSAGPAAQANQPTHGTQAALPGTRAGDALLSVEDLHVGFDTERGPVTVVDGVTFDVRKGEVLALVGESGSGKTVTSLSIMRLLQSPPGQVTGGRVMFEGRDLLDLPIGQMRAVRGEEIAMVFQNPMTSLDGAYTVGNLVGDAIRTHRDLGRAALRARAVELLELVGIPDAASRLHDYPHQFSGGMRQRVMIAMALACEPKLLIADEPTTALDVTVQAQILDLLQRLRTELDMSVILVTHDLGVVADICDRVAVMYAGQIVEQAPVHDLFAAPQHPYTEGLLAAMPQTGRVGEPLYSIPGVVPTADRMPVGCRFHPRCPHAVPACAEAPVAMRAGAPGHEVRCIRADELTLRGTAS